MYISDQEFYSSYDWCLNPILTLQDLCGRIREELNRHESLDASWQREESTINLYLFLCGACCTIDDYLAYRPFKLEAILHRFRRLGGIITLARMVRNTPYTVRTLMERRRIRRWRRDLLPCVDAICDILVAEPEGRQVHWTKLRSALQPVLNTQLPARPLLWRVRIPEGFRCQDLSHHDVLEMAKRLIQFHDVANRSFFVVAPRTAGAYFAPLFKAYLVYQGISVLGWMTLRPKDGVSPFERREMQRLVSTQACALIIDDHPNTGSTLMMIASLITRLGARPDNVVMFAPDHPSEIPWKQAVSPVATVSLPPSEFHKQKILNDPAAVESLLRQFYADRGWENVRLQSNDEVNAVNLQLSAHYADGFHVRLKRVFDVQLLSSHRQPLSTRLIAKSVGWGWLGYHAYIAAERLRGFVPPMIGLRHGLLFTEWIGAVDLSANLASPERILAVVPSYVAARVTHLHLAEDPCFGSVGYRWTGWDKLVDILRRPYGLYNGHFMASLIRRQLKKYIAPLPTMVDGRMTLSNWVEDGTGVYKTDFEQHNFGGAEPDIVDPAYDLASVIEHLELSEAEEQQLIDTYVRQSGDESVNSRILLYKILYSNSVMQYAIYGLNRNPLSSRSEYLNRLYLSARNFLIYHMNRHTATLFGKLEPAIWSDRLFFLDLDGVLGDQVFGDYTQTTPDGLLALRALRSRGYSAVLNTGRSVEHVRNYCQSYALPGGVAEFGSVFLDNVHHREMGLVDPEVLEQLTRCRELIQQLPGVFTDPTCRWTVRAYRFTDRETVGLPEWEIQRVLNMFRSDKLRVITRDEDSYIVSKNVTKGTGLSAVKQNLEMPPHSVAAIGTSAHDLDMLRLADIAYIPANACSPLKALAGDPKYRFVRKSQQKGLLASVRDLLRDEFPITCERKAMLARESGSRHLIDHLLFAAERSRCCQLVDLLRRRTA